MTLNFKTRNAARTFAKSRSDKGHPTKVVDAGKDAAKRYSCDVSKKGN